MKGTSDMSKKTKPILVHRVLFKEREYTFCSGSLSDVVARLQKLQDEFGTEWSLQLELKASSGYYDDFNVDVIVNGERFETEAEMTSRLEDEAAARVQREVWERQQYEALKKKFEGK